LGSGAREIRNIVGEHASTSVLKYVSGHKTVQNLKKLSSLKIQENIFFGMEAW
jgi:hypothetical protein